MPVAKDSSQAKVSVQNRSNAQNVGVGAISLPAVAAVPLEKVETNQEQQQTQLKSVADLNNPAGNPENNKKLKGTGSASQPAQLNAIAFAPGTQIHVAPGQEQHVAHEAWHVVQQKQGRVQPTMQMKQGIPVNDDKGLEEEADLMGAKAIQGKFTPEFAGESRTSHISEVSRMPFQRKVIISNPAKEEDDEMTIDRLAELDQSEPITAIIRGWINDDIEDDRDYLDETKVVMAAKEFLHKSQFNGTLVSLANELKANEMKGMGHLSDDTLWDILKRGFGANWFKAKSCLIMNRWPGGVTAPFPDHTVSMDLMQALVTMRKNKWAEFAEKALPVVQGIVKDPSLKIQPPDGSTSVTSDMDLSITGTESEASIKELNDLFKTKFDVPFEPGTVFDINMYSLDWMHGDTEKFSGTPGNRVSTIHPEKEPGLYGITPGKIAGRSENQEMWSYVKIMRNLIPDEITAYITSVLANFTGEGDKEKEDRVKMSQKLNDAKLATAAFKLKVKTRADSMIEEFMAKMVAKGLDPDTSAFKDEAGEHDNEAYYTNEARTTSASNAIYQETVAEVKALRTRIKKMNAGGEDIGVENLAKLLADKIAEALTYANEVYATEGGVLHTVYGKQKAKKKEAAYAKSADNKDIKTVKTALSKEQYIQSINENVGDSVHALNHNSHMPKYAVFRSGKYLDRLCEATELINAEAAAGFTNYTLLKKLGKFAADNKELDLGKDPYLVNAEPTFESYTTKGHVMALKQQVIDFGSQATSYFNKTP